MQIRTSNDENVYHLVLETHFRWYKLYRSTALEEQELGYAFSYDMAIKGPIKYRLELRLAL